MSQKLRGGNKLLAEGDATPFHAHPMPDAARARGSHPAGLTRASVLECSEQNSRSDRAGGNTALNSELGDSFSILKY